MAAESNSTSLPPPPRVDSSGGGFVATDFAGSSGAATSKVVRKLYAKQVIAKEIDVKLLPANVYTGLVQNRTALRIGGSDLKLYLSSDGNTPICVEEWSTNPSSEVIDFSLPFPFSKLTLATFSSSVVHFFHPVPYYLDTVSGQWKAVPGGTLSPALPAPPLPVPDQGGSKIVSTFTMADGSEYPANTKFKIALHGNVDEVDNQWEIGYSIYISIYANF